MANKLKTTVPKAGKDANLMYDLKLYGAYDLYKKILPNTRSDVSNRGLYAMVETAKKAGVSLKDLRDYGVIRRGYSKYDEQKYRDQIIDEKRLSDLKAKGKEYIKHMSKMWDLFMDRWREIRKEDWKRADANILKGSISSNKFSPVSELIDEFALEKGVDAFDLRMYARFSGKGNLTKDDYANKR